ncbi:MAG: hypothetical protein CO096_18590 [Armatimonadetes bacterium CG_4_9_14_3_um_filter_66_14]|nr:MAG: hypothetical protein CO096_18590 [Armatimonadetes bacterium CG_4_9_14_3_um_filter_66_14]
MASWTDMAAEALVAAKILRDAGQWRSAVSRAYYAAFSALTAELSDIVGHGFGKYEHPPHREMARLIERHLKQHLRTGDSDWLKSLIRRLYKARLDADYVSGASIDVRLARDAHAVFRLLEVPT